MLIGTKNILFAVLGTRLVIVLGVQQLVDTELQRQGVEPRYVRGYRITDAAAMQAAKEAAGAARLEVEAYLSKVRPLLKADTNMCVLSRCAKGPSLMYPLSGTGGAHGPPAHTQLCGPGGVPLRARHGRREWQLCHWPAPGGCERGRLWGYWLR